MFEIIDKELENWVKSKKLHIDKLYKDEEVRSISINTVNGNKFQMWIEVLDNEEMTINGWDYKKMKIEFHAKKDNFIDSLNGCYNKIIQWDSK